MMSKNKPSMRSFLKYSLEYYIEHPEEVKRLNDAAIDYLEAVLDENNQVHAELKTALRENLLLKERAHLTVSMLGFQVFLQIVGIVLIGMGVYLVTQPSSSSLGMLLIACGAVIELLSFTIIAISRSRKVNK